MSDTTEMVTETAERVSEADFAEFARQLNKAKVRFAVGGWILGATTGAFFAYKFASRKIETKYSQIATDEIAEMREHYQAKSRALEGKTQKPDLDSIVAEKGYSSPTSAPPMAVPPPESVATKEDEAEEDDSEAEVQNIFREATVEDTWDYHEELRKRSPDIPYIIHYDERKELDYDEITLTYYEVDDVICDERDEIFDTLRRNNVLGGEELLRFGHGSNDASIVYIRNDKLELVFEVVRSPNSFAEEVHGFSHESYYRGNLERMRVKERDDPEE